MVCVDYAYYAHSDIRCTETRQHLQPDVHAQLSMHAAIRAHWFALCIPICGRVYDDFLMSLNVSSCTGIVFFITTSLNYFLRLQISAQPDNSRLSYSTPAIKDED